MSTTAATRSASNTRATRQNEPITFENIDPALHSTLHSMADRTSGEDESNPLADFAQHVLGQSTEEADQLLTFNLDHDGQTFERILAEGELHAGGNGPQGELEMAGVEPFVGKGDMEDGGPVQSETEPSRRGRRRKYGEMTMEGDPARMKKDNHVSGHVTKRRLITANHIHLNV